MGRMKWDELQKKEKKIMTWAELYNLFMDHNDKNPDQKLFGYVVFKESNWPGKNFSEQARTYEVCSCDWGFMPGKISNAVYGDCLDGTDVGVRLDWHDWEKEYCYMV